MCKIGWDQWEDIGLLNSITILLIVIHSRFGPSQFEFDCDRLSEEILGKGQFCGRHSQCCWRWSVQATIIGIGGDQCGFWHVAVIVCAGGSFLSFCRLSDHMLLQSFGDSFARGAETIRLNYQVVTWWHPGWDPFMNNLQIWIWSAELRFCWVYSTTLHSICSAILLGYFHFCQILVVGGKSISFCRVGLVIWMINFLWMHSLGHVWGNVGWGFLLILSLVRAVLAHLLQWMFNCAS